MKNPLKRSDHYDGERFFNPSGRGTKNLSDVLKWMRTRKATPWPEKVENTYPVHLPKEIPAGNVAITFINHATFLIQTPAYTLITDPLFSERASPFSFMGPKRVRKPGIDLEALPKIDFVLISHNHYDHLDLETLRVLEEKFHPIFLVPLGNKAYLEEHALKNVIEMDWWDTYFGPDLEITFTPAEHWSSRWPWDRNKTLWGGFVVNTEHQKIFHAGDTGYGEHFSKIASRFGNMDVSLLPIGAYEPRWFMKDSHMNPEEAVQAHEDLKSKLSIGMHFGTFQLTDEGIDEPVKTLQKLVSEKHVDFMTLEVGQTLIKASSL